MPSETPSRARALRSSESRRRRAPLAGEAPDEAHALAAFELLADPDTIAGRATAPQPPAVGEPDPGSAREGADSDLERPDRRRAERVASRTGSPTGPAVLGPDPTESARLDVAAATRLAEEAHRRQRATRAALEAERAALAAPDSRLRPTSTDPAPAPALPVPSSTPAAPKPADEPPLGWTRHPLVSGELPSAEQIEAADERACEVPPRRE